MTDLVEAVRALLASIYTAGDSQLAFRCVGIAEELVLRNALVAYDAAQQEAASACDHHEGQSGASRAMYDGDEKCPACGWYYMRRVEV